MSQTNTLRCIISDPPQKKVEIMHQRIQNLLGLACLALSPILLIIYSLNFKTPPAFSTSSGYVSSFLDNFSSSPSPSPLTSSYDVARSDILAQMDELAASFSEKPSVDEPSIPQTSPANASLVTLKEGMTLGNLLETSGATKEDAHNITVSLSKVYNPRHFKAGCEISLKWLEKDQEKAVIEELSFILDFGKKIVVSRTSGGSYKASLMETPLDKELHRISFSIESSVFASAASKGISSRVLAPLTQALSYDLDLQRDIHSGDKFEIVMEQITDPLTNQKRFGKIMYAALHPKKRASVRLYAFTNPSTGQTQFYNERGESLRKGLMRTPISGAKISSGFGTRKDPIQGYTTRHKGVDFRAPQGTPVMAAGDGKVLLASRSGGLGNCVKISHNKTYTTAYAHLSKFAKGVRPGKFVKQGMIIGYVGRTGRATGPHLHFEVHKNGVHVNPNSVRSMSSGKLEGRLLKSFLAAKKTMDTQIAHLPITSTLALKDLLSHQG